MTITKEQIERGNKQVLQLEYLCRVTTTDIEANSIARDYVENLQREFINNTVQSFEEFLTKYDRIIKGLYQKLN